MISKFLFKRRRPKVPFHVPKVSFRFLDKSKSEIQNTVINTNNDNANSNIANFRMLNRYLIWISNFFLYFLFSPKIPRKTKYNKTPVIIFVIKDLADNYCNNHVASNCGRTQAISSQALYCTKVKEALGKPPFQKKIFSSFIL